MPIGPRQLAVLTAFAREWPSRMSTNQVLTTFPRWPTRTKMFILPRLEKKEYIEDHSPDGYHHQWQLTRQGWRAIHKAKKGPVKVTVWDDDGWPLDVNIRKSLRPEFADLYLTDEEREDLKAKQSEEQ